MEKCNIPWGDGVYVLVWGSACLCMRMGDCFSLLLLLVLLLIFSVCLIFFCCSNGRHFNPLSTLTMTIKFLFYSILFLWPQLGVLLGEFQCKTQYMKPLWPLSYWLQRLNRRTVIQVDPSPEGIFPSSLFSKKPVINWWCRVLIFWKSLPYQRSLTLHTNSIGYGSPFASVPLIA